MTLSRWAVFVEVVDEAAEAVAVVAPCRSVAVQAAARREVPVVDSDVVEEDLGLTRAEEEPVLVELFEVEFRNDNVDSANKHSHKYCYFFV